MSRGRRNARGRQATLAGTVLTVALLLAWQYLGIEGPLPDVGRDTPPPGASERAPSATRASNAERIIEDAVREHRSGFMITLDATVLKLLSDDNEGSRHQRFIVELASGRTLLVAHNIDLADRVPLGRGDRVRIHGQYEWNERGGVLHWTHYDPEGRHEGGWVEHEGIRYGDLPLEEVGGLPAGQEDPA